ncbi:hypothetical protein [Lactobacillus johnsonii]
MEERKLKWQTICYASHIDSCIFQYYSFLINERYNSRLKQDNIYEVPIAYRTDLHTDTIVEFQKLHQFMIVHLSYYVVIGDFTSFFDRIDHQYLKKRLCDLLQVDKLSSDCYKICKRINEYDYWKLKDLYRLNNLDPKKKKDKIKLNSKTRILSQSDYKKYRSHIKQHQDNKEIPQVSSISERLANVYILKIDKMINEFVVTCGGIYRRYSDDFIIILSADTSSLDNLKKIILKFEEFKDRGVLELQLEKTQVYKLQNYSVVAIGHFLPPQKKIE